jgi:hypothetical protein
MIILANLLLSVLFDISRQPGSFAESLSHSGQAVGSCSQQCSGSSVPAEWQKMDAEGIFTFHLPPDMKRSSASGIESLYRHYSNGRMSCYFVYQPYSYLSYDSRKGEGKMNYRESILSIGDRKAILFTYEQDDEGRKSFHTELYVGNWAAGQVELIMSVASSEQLDMKLAKQILASVCFAHPFNTRMGSL